MRRGWLRLPQVRSRGPRTVETSPRLSARWPPLRVPASWLVQALNGTRLSGRPRGRVGLASAFIWLVFIVFPLANAIGHHGPALRRGLTVAGATAFVVAYVLLVLIWRTHRHKRTPVLLFAVLIAVAIALTLGDRGGWGFLFTYCAACTALVYPTSLGFGGVLLCATLAGVTSAVGGAASGQAIGFAASAIGVGLLMVLVRDLRTRNDELTEARAELARLAVAEERERFARDLHDLLGHSLSVIALKAELAGRLLPGRPDEAAEEVAELEQVARGALTEVREAVSGYRQPTLDGELAGARMALSAAGIDADVELPQVPLDPEVEAVLAWAVREGATNVIRHSGASHCKVRVGAGLTEASVEVVDDGVGAVGRNGSGTGVGANSAGHGLVGLAERAQVLHGRLEAGSPPNGGFRLVVTVPSRRGAAPVESR